MLPSLLFHTWSQGLDLITQSCPFRFLSRPYEPYGIKGRTSLRLVGTVVLKPLTWQCHIRGLVYDNPILVVCRYLDGLDPKAACLDCAYKPTGSKQQPPFNPFFQILFWTAKFGSARPVSTLNSLLTGSFIRRVCMV